MGIEGESLRRTVLHFFIYLVGSNRWRISKGVFLGATEVQTLLFLSMKIKEVFKKNGKWEIRNEKWEMGNGK